MITGTTILFCVALAFALVVYCMWILFVIVKNTDYEQQALSDSEKKDKINKQLNEFKNVARIIDEAKTIEHLKAAKNMVDTLINRHPDRISYIAMITNRLEAKEEELIFKHKS